MCGAFHTYFDDYRRYLQSEKRYSSHTITAYCKDLEQFAAYLSNTASESLTLNELRIDQIRGWLFDLREGGLEARSVNRKRSSLNGYFIFLMRQGFCSNNPVALLHGIKLPERVPQFLRPAETEMLLGELHFSEGFKGKTEQIALELLYSCGLRRNELCGLKESDIDWSLQQLKVRGKGGKERLIPLGAALLDALKAYLEEKTQTGGSRKALLVTESGKKIYDKYVYRLAHKYLSMVSSLKQKSPHILRHTFATHLLNNGANIQSIKELLGHSSIAATQIYTHINIDKLKKVHKLSHPKG
jgi:integrase/recombinase XerC